MEQLLNVVKNPFNQLSGLRLVQKLVSIHVWPNHPNSLAPYHQPSLLNAEFNNQNFIVRADVTPDLDEIKALHSQRKEAG